MLKVQGQKVDLGEKSDNLFLSKLSIPRHHHPIENVEDSQEF